MPADAQDTHIMKAHLRKHEVFHNIANARENVVFNNSLGNRNHRSQHLVGTSFQRLEDTDMRKIKTGEFPDAGWFVCWLVGDAEPLHPAEAPSAPPGGGDRSGVAFRNPRGGIVAEALSAPPGEGDRARSTFHHPQQYLPSTDRTRSTLRHPRQHPPSTREARSAIPSSACPQDMKG